MNAYQIDPTSESVGRFRHSSSILHDRVLMFCIVLAFFIHSLLIFGLSFVAPGGDRAKMQDVSIAVRLSQKPNDDADFVAQANQEGSGILRNTHRMTSPRHQQSPETVASPAQAVTQKTVSAAPVEQQAQAQVLTTTLSWQKVPSQNRQQRQQQAQPMPTEENQQMAQIAALEAEYAKRKQEYSRKTKVKTVDSVSTKADPSAAYLDQFRRRVENFGNKHYPSQARAQGLSGDVRLMVILRPDGSVRAIRLLSSSGHPMLDEAAKDSVRQAAPYGNFGTALKDYSELRIIRTWRFSEKMEDLDVSP